MAKNYIILCSNSNTANFLHMYTWNACKTLIDTVKSVKDNPLIYLNDGRTLLFIRECGEITFQGDNVVRVMSEGEYKLELNNYVATGKSSNDAVRAFAKTLKSVLWISDEVPDEKMALKDVHKVIDDILDCHYKSES